MDNFFCEEIPSLEPKIDKQTSQNSLLCNTIVPERRIAFPKTQQPLLAWSGIHWAAWHEPRHSSHVTVCTDGWNAMGGAKNPFFLLSIPKNHKKVNAICNVQMATRALEVMVWDWNIKFWKFKSCLGPMQHIYNGKTTVWLFECVCVLLYDSYIHGVPHDNNYF